MQNRKVVEDYSANIGNNVEPDLPGTAVERSSRRLVALRKRFRCLTLLFVPQASHR
jgi:hypothetical protein